VRTLTVSIGNSTIRVGRFVDGRLARVTVLPQSAARRPGDWQSSLRWPVDQVVLVSVVPNLSRPVGALLRRQTGRTPEVLTAGSDHGLKIAYRRPGELGVDRLAAALGARELLPRRSAIVVDCGTATTFTVVHRTKGLLGGAILPGPELAALSLFHGTAQLPLERPGRVRRATGRSPSEAIRSGIFYGQVGAIRELAARLKAEVLGGERVTLIGTGGHAQLFKPEKLFTVYEPNLILLGLHAYTKRLTDHA